MESPAMQSFRSIGRSILGLALRSGRPGWLRLLLVGLLGAAAGLAHAAFLQPDQAFRLTASAASANTVQLRLDIAKGYYLYEERFHFSSPTPGVVLGKPQFPPAHRKFDPNLGHEVAHYRKQVLIPLPVRDAPRKFALKVVYQGCSDQGLCYPPIDKVLQVSLQAFGGDGTVALQGAAPPTSMLGSLLGGQGTTASAPAAAPAPDQGSRIGRLLAGASLLRIVPTFLLFGLLLAFTPCVLPMVPILSSIIVGQGAGEGRVSRWRGLGLAAAYSLGMALVYTAFGVAAGLLGHGLAAALQNPWVLSLFALLLVLLSLSMFGLYELQMPSAIQSRLSRGSSALPGGRVLGVFAMGGISALIVGPCVAAPLAGALLYISQTGNALIGGVALFALAAGMSLPLLAVGFGAAALLPRAGRWMDAVKSLFGILLLATALYMLASVLPAWLQMLAWAALLLVSASFLHVFDRLADDASGWLRLWKGLGVLLALAGAVLVIGVAAGSRDLLQPLQGLRGTTVAEASAAMPLRFAPVHSSTELDHALAAAPGTVMLDFWADWCVSCKEMDRFTFTDPRVRARLQRLTLLRADVTTDSAADQALLKRFDLFGPPGMIFFRDGKVVGRVVGEQDARQFLRSLQRAGA